MLHFLIFSAIISTTLLFTIATPIQPKSSSSELTIIQNGLVTTEYIDWTHATPDNTTWIMDDRAIKNNVICRTPKDGMLAVPIKGPRHFEEARGLFCTWASIVGNRIPQGKTWSTEISGVEGESGEPAIFEGRIINNGAFPKSSGPVKGLQEGYVVTKDECLRATASYISDDEAGSNYRACQDDTGATLGGFYWDNTFGVSFTAWAIPAARRSELR